MYYECVRIAAQTELYFDAVSYNVLCLALQTNCEYLFLL